MSTSASRPIWPSDQSNRCRWMLDSTSASTVAATSPARCTASCATAIVAGALRPGDRLPATRELADRLEVSRTTVTVAYDRLMGEGFLVARVGAGTFVSDDVGVAAAERRRPRRARCGRGRSGRTVAHAVPAVRCSPRTTSAAGCPTSTASRTTSWRRLVGRQIRPAAAAGSTYGEAAGQPGLRAALARHLGVSRAVEATGRRHRRHQRPPAGRSTSSPACCWRRATASPSRIPATRRPGRLLQTLGMDVVGRPGRRRGHRRRRHPGRHPRSCSSRRRTSSRSATRCRCAVASPCCAGPSATTRRSSRTTTTASSASAAGRSSRCRASTRSGRVRLRRVVLQDDAAVAAARLRRRPGVAPLGRARRQVRHRLVVVDAAAAGARRVHRPRLVRPPPAGDARPVPRAPRADLDAPSTQRVRRRRSAAMPVAGRAAPQRSPTPDRDPDECTAVVHGRRRPRRRRLLARRRSASLEPRHAGIVIGYGASRHERHPRGPATHRRRAAPALTVERVRPSTCDRPRTAPAARA